MDSIEITSSAPARLTAVAESTCPPCVARRDHLWMRQPGTRAAPRIARVLQLERVFAFDADERRARELAEELSPSCAFRLQR